MSNLKITAYDKSRVGSCEMIHVLKSWPTNFERFLDKQGKLYEVRRADRPYRPGDTLLIREFEPSTQTYTGRLVTAEIRTMSTWSTWSKEQYVCFVLDYPFGNGLL
jgi:hypothetical protein